MDHYFLEIHYLQFQFCGLWYRHRHCLSLKCLSVMACAFSPRIAWKKMLKSKTQKRMVHGRVDRNPYRGGDDSIIFSNDPISRKTDLHSTPTLYFVNQEGLGKPLKCYFFLVVRPLPPFLLVAGPLKKGRKNIGFPNPLVQWRSVFFEIGAFENIIQYIDKVPER